MLKKIYILAAVFLLFFCFQVSSVLAAETTVDETCKTDTTINIVARDSSGAFIPNINYELYEQITDVDGNLKPNTAKKAGSGKIDSVSGRGVAKVKMAKLSDIKIYVLKMWQTNSANSFYFYDSANVGCGSTVDVSATLSSFKVILRDVDENLKKNTSFSFYIQKTDADGNPVKEKGALVGTYNTGDFGGNIVYLPNKTRNILNGAGSDDYVLEVKNDKGYLFTKYDLNVEDGETAEVNYVLSQLRLTFKTANGSPLVKGSKVVLYEQSINSKNQAVLGKVVSNLTTDEAGLASLECPAGSYAAAVTDSNKKQNFYYDLDLGEGDKGAYKLVVGSGEKSCDPLSFTMQIKKFNGNPIGDLKYQLYERVSGSNGAIIAGALLGGGTLDVNGKSIIQISPNSAKYYILKVYGYNENVGDFWFYDSLQFVCGKDKAVIKTIPSLKIILRQGNGDLLKNQAFSLYAQKIDVNGNGVNEKKDLVGAFTTNSSGFAEIFVAPENPYNQSKNGVYALVVAGKNKVEYTEWGVVINPAIDKTVDYTLSDISLKLQDAANNPLKKTAFSLFKQKSTTEKGDAFGSFVTNENGVAVIEGPAGTYMLTMKDALGLDFQIPGVLIADKSRTDVGAITNLSKIAVVNGAGVGIKAANVDVYSIKKEGENKYIKDKKIKTFKASTLGTLDLVLAPGEYLFETVVNKTAYGKTAVVKVGVLQNVVINTSKDKTDASQVLTLNSSVAVTSSLIEKVKGQILLQVEARGEAWYLDPASKKRFYLKDGAAAYSVMRKLSLGITNTDLAKIPVGLDGDFDEDTDGDGLSDKLEEALGTNPNDSDTDGDSYKDGTEVSSGYNPLSTNPVKENFDKALTEKLKGRILLEVESGGRAWYVNPNDSKRYYIKDGETAYKIMRKLGLGITNANLENITVETLE